MKIAYFSYLYDIKGISAGSANKAIGFVGGLRALGHRVSMHWRSAQPEEAPGKSMRLAVRSRLKKHLSNYVHDPKKLATNLIWLVQEYRILKREKPDILLLRSELYNVSGNLAAWMLGIPVVLEVDCPVAYEHRRMWVHRRFVFPLLPEWIERWNLKTSRAVIAISELLKEHLVKNGVPASAVTVVPNGADPDMFRPVPGAAAIRRRLGIPDRATVVGWIGSLFGWSGIENLLRAATALLALRKRIVLLFVGGGKNQEVIERTFAPEDVGSRVFLTGTVPYNDVPQYVNAMDVVLVPYPKHAFWYPSSMKLFEYMSAQKAVVASAVPQVDGVIRDGWNGLLYDPEDPDAFTAKILKAVDFPGIRRFVEEGIIPGGLIRNRKYREGQVEIGPSCPDWLVDILFDPQTAGGLLIALPPGAAEGLLRKMHETGIAAAAIVGEVTEAPKGKIILL